MTEMSVETINKACEGKPYTNEMIMVDNGSTFAAGYLREVADIYIRNKINLGYPGAVNQGLAVGTGDIFCISNNDIRVPDNIFDVGLEILQDPKVGSVHYKMIHYDEPFNFGRTTWKTGRERFCTSSFFLIKREALPQGNYDLGYGRGGIDDYDFWMRVRYVNGWQTAITNKSAYQHWGSWTLSKVPELEKSDKNQTYFISKWGEEADKLFAKKHPEQWAINYWDGMSLDDEP
jgi:glycosyltransferase involved in cell wall biosynthesis